MKKFAEQIDWVLLIAIVPIMLGGLATMTSFSAQAGFFLKQAMWLGVGIAIMIALARSDMRFLRDSRYITLFYIASLGLLLLVLIAGKTVKGAKSWFSFGFFSFEPADLVKLLVIMVLAKYFARRHVDIARVKHLFISVVYAFVPIGLIMLQPDFGSAMVIAGLWLGMSLVAGISKKQILIIVGAFAVVFALMWGFVFKPYQKARIDTFFNPTADVRGRGYNAYQSVIAVGSGGFLGKGLGYGTQSRLNYLPEYQTDFIFAAFAEEWGFIGALIIIACFVVVLWRLIVHARRGASNFETLFCAGFALLLFEHIIVNIGMNIGIMPVTGIPLPFMSYGGSHILAECVGLGIILSMSKYERAMHPDDINNEFIGYAQPY
ncbi:MAG TPA: rod shape-determining protein RodA [Candidatus Paceibacterota bacterium]|jgi:rod shape determining protein RodA|nr:rod shape-determining protein RodA [Candidatus Paceibacterota bacterium]